MGTDYETMVNRNTANLNALNDMNKTPIYYASPVRKRAFGWNALTGNVLDYEQLTKGDNRSKGDRDMQELELRIHSEANNKKVEEERRFKSKQPSSLTKAEEDNARALFKANRIRGTMNFK